MKLLYNYDLKDYNPEWPHSTRPSARAIILFDNNKIALVHSKKLNYYKFPGGGIHSDEKYEIALIREVQEETGLIVIEDSIKEYGYIQRLQKSNYLPDTIFEQNSYYYTCNVTNEITEQNLDKYEADEGFELAIVSIEDAIKTNKSHIDDNEFNIVMIARDTLVLERLINADPLPSIRTANFLLKNCALKNPGPWEKHSIAVANSARKMAEAIVLNGGNMNPDKAYVVGLLHDIGRQEGYTYMRHVIDGFKYLKALGYESAAKICLTHSFNLHIIDDYIGKIDVTDAEYKEIRDLLAKIEYDDYDRLIQLLDSTCGADGTINLEDRMNDVKARYGYYPQGKWDKNFELKEYFEKLMGKEFYSVIKTDNK